MVDPTRRQELRNRRNHPRMARVEWTPTSKGFEMNEEFVPPLSAAVPVDTACLLVVDPCHLPADLVERLLAERLAVVMPTYIPLVDADGVARDGVRGDGWYVVDALCVNGPSDDVDYEDSHAEWLGE